MRLRDLLVVTMVLGACSDDDEATTATSSTTETVESTTSTTAAVEPVTILVTNDDGVGAPGIDAVVEALRDDPALELVGVAPAENQSGAGDATTVGATATPATTASGFAAVAVGGRPADAVNHALDVVFAGTEPDLVISGINEGQNLGPIVDISGTVGAARTASRRGIPSVAISQGLPPEGAEPDYEAGVDAMLAWLDDNLDALEDALVVSINVPTCAAGEVRGAVEVPTAADTANGNPVQIADCTSTLADPPDDIAAFNAGFVTVSEPGLGS